MREKLIDATLACLVVAFHAADETHSHRFETDEAENVAGQRSYAV